MMKAIVLLGLLSATTGCHALYARSGATRPDRPASAYQSQKNRWTEQQKQSWAQMEETHRRRIQAEQHRRHVQALEESNRKWRDQWDRQQAQWRQQRDRQQQWDRQQEQWRQQRLETFRKNEAALDAQRKRASEQRRKNTSSPAKPYVSPYRSFSPFTPYRPFRSY